MSTLTIIGATGLVGCNFTTLAAECKFPGINNICTVTRRAFTPDTTSVTPITNQVSSDIPNSIPAGTKILFSGLGTTKAAANGFDNQFKIDHDMNLDAAKTAKAQGASTYVLISAGGAAVDSMFAYNSMKGLLEKDVIDLGFERTIILRPGLIIGDRNEKRAAEHAAQILFKGLRSVPIFGSLLKSAGADADKIAKAAIVAIQQGGSGVQIYGNSEILDLASQYST
ncbi:NAD dependent epimerase/ dehydratase-like protein [Dipodascopsis uninucleata]